MLIEELTAEPLNTTIALIGAPGAGKTHCLSTFRPADWKPGDKPWMFLLACDKKAHGGAEILMKKGKDGLPIGAGIELGVYRDIITTPPDAVDKMPPPQAYERFLQQLNKLFKLARMGDFPYHVIAIDSFTGLWDAIALLVVYRRTLRYIRKGKEKRTLELSRVGLEQGDYLECYNWIHHFFRSFVHLPCIKVVTFHRQIRYEAVKNPHTKQWEDRAVGVEPLIVGRKFPEELMGSFEYAFYFDETPSPSGERFVHTVLTPRTPAKVGLGSFPKKCPADWKVWEKHIREDTGSTGKES